MEKLTKENFWNELMEKYPGEMETFCQWIDEYKKRPECSLIFYPPYCNGENGRQPTIKYHDLPIAMQIGIFLQFVAETPNQYGVELPEIKTMQSFEKIPEIIKEYFYHEQDAKRDDHLEEKNSESDLYFTMD